MGSLRALLLLPTATVGVGIHNLGHGALQLGHDLWDTTPLATAEERPPWGLALESLPEAPGCASTADLEWREGLDRSDSHGFVVCSSGLPLAAPKAPEHTLRLTHPYDTDPRGARRRGRTMGAGALRSEGRTIGLRTAPPMSGHLLLSADDPGRPTRAPQPSFGHGHAAPSARPRPPSARRRGPRPGRPPPARPLPRRPARAGPPRRPHGHRRVHAGPLDPRPQPPGRPRLRACPLRRAPRPAVRQRGVRPRGRRLHRRHSGRPRPRPRGPRGHVVLRRDRRGASRRPTQAAPLPRPRAGAPRRQPQLPPSRHAHPRRRHRDLQADPGFREDLWYRLDALQLTLSSLVQRPEDLPSLARHLVATEAARDGLDRLRLTREAFGGAHRPGLARQRATAPP